MSEIENKQPNEMGASVDGLSPAAIEFLKKPLNMRRVKSRKQAGRELSYLEGHDAISCANYIFGFGNWGYSITHTEYCTYAPVPYYAARVMLTVKGCMPVEEEGIGIVAKPRDGGETSAEAHETARKGAVTDAMKRALRTYGNQFGNSLYSK